MFSQILESISLSKITANCIIQTILHEYIKNLGNVSNYSVAQESMVPAKRPESLKVMEDLKF